ncbi:hypothetical protein OZ411_27315 [Bradyrhizobium sp. Arg237L]|nr:hypothetical protein [Bradyrhizobium sp. Arg237L]MDI4236528.1 hypothetical protein [Bradyrhizobium sp. Arg237L]
MFSRVSAKFAAIPAAREWRRRLIVGAVMVAAALGGCQPKTVPIGSADPANPAAPVPRVTYRPTLAPYSSLRPATPMPWRDRNDAVAPKSNSDGGER